MKVRTGFVSNSSSSSFVIVIKDQEVLEQLEEMLVHVEDDEWLGDETGLHDHGNGRYSVSVDWCMTDLFEDVDDYIKSESGKHVDELPDCAKFKIETQWSC